MKTKKVTRKTINDLIRSLSTIDNIEEQVQDRIDEIITFWCDKSGFVLDDWNYEIDFETIFDFDNGYIKVKVYGYNPGQEELTKIIDETGRELKIGNFPISWLYSNYESKITKGLQKARKINKNKKSKIDNILKQLTDDEMIELKKALAREHL